jgi:hypothetical protein
MKLYTKCANCDEIVTETFTDEGNCNMQAVLKSASVNHNCKQATAQNALLNAAIPEQQEQEDSAFITLQKLQFGDIR